MRPNTPFHNTPPNLRGFMQQPGLQEYVSTIADQINPKAQAELIEGRPGMEVTAHFITGLLEAIRRDSDICVSIISSHQRQIEGIPTIAGRGSASGVSNVQRLLQDALLPTHKTLYLTRIELIGSAFALYFKGSTGVGRMMTKIATKVVLRFNERVREVKIEDRWSGTRTPLMERATPVSFNKDTGRFEPIVEE